MYLKNHKVILLPHAIPETMPVDSVNGTDLSVSSDPVLIEIDSSIQGCELNALLNNDILSRKLSNSTNDDNCILNEGLLVDNWEDVTPENLNQQFCQESSYNLIKNYLLRN